MTPPTKMSLALGTLLVALGAIIGIRATVTQPPVPMPPGPAQVIPDPAFPGKCWKIQDNGFTEPWPCPTPTPATMPWTQKIVVTP